MTEYIERGALSKFVRDVRKRLPKDSKDFFTRDEMLLNFQQYVDAQAAADVEPVVHARWVVDTAWSTPPTRTKCSACGFTELYADYDRCPNCGAHMDLKEERK